MDITSQLFLWMEKVKLVSYENVSNPTLRSLSVSEKPLMLSLAANNSFLVSTFSNGFRSVMSKLFNFLIFIFPHCSGWCRPVAKWRRFCSCPRGFTTSAPSPSLQVSVPCPEYWPLIGQYRSFDLNTGLWLVNMDHVTWILSSDWIIM